MGYFRKDSLPGPPRWSYWNQDYSARLNYTTYNYSFTIDDHGANTRNGNLKLGSYDQLFPQISIIIKLSYVS